MISARQKRTCGRMILLPRSYLAFVQSCARVARAGGLAAARHCVSAKPGLVPPANWCRHVERKEDCKGQGKMHRLRLPSCHIRCPSPILCGASHSDAAAAPRKEKLMTQRKRNSFSSVQWSVIITDAECAAQAATVAAVLPKAGGRTAQAS